MGAESTCLFRPLKNYLFGLLVLFFYFFRQARVRINHILTQQTWFFFFLKTTKSDIKTHRSSLMILLCPPQTRHSPHAWLPQQTALIRPPHLGKGRKVITPVTKVPIFPFSSCCRLSGGRCSYIYSRPTSPQHGQTVGKQAQGRLIRKAHYTCSRRQTPSCQAGGMM